MLRRLFDTLEESPLALAVIPRPADESLARAVEDTSTVTVTQHGWAHRNHAPLQADVGAWELDPFRPGELVLADMARGKGRLEQLFGRRYHPVMVAPWNRVHPGLFAGLQRLGFVGVSAMGECHIHKPVKDFWRIDCRFDALRWKQGPRFAGWQRASHALLEILSGSGGDTVCGINIHHRVTDAEGWQFIALLNRVVSSHPGSRWAGPVELFGPSA